MHRNVDVHIRSYTDTHTHIFKKKYNYVSLCTGLCTRVICPHKFEIRRSEGCFQMGRFAMDVIRVPWLVKPEGNNPPDMNTSHLFHLHPSG